MRSQRLGGVSDVAAQTQTNKQTNYWALRAQERKKTNVPG